MLLNPEFQAVVVVQLAQGLLPISEVRGSNPVIGHFCVAHVFLLTVENN